MDLPDATWTDADATGAEIVLLPVGSTEQHGPHAPLATDTLIASTVADVAAESFDGEVIVAPPFPYGISEEHRAFPGTVWLSPDTFRAAVRDVCRSLIHHGWQRIVFVNGHGGNIAALEEVAADVSRHEEGYVVSFTWFEAVGEHSSDMGHGGRLETAVLRARYPDLVREDCVASAAAEGSDRWGEWQSGVNLAHTVDEFTENGVIGDPSAGDATLGEELVRLSSENLVELLEVVASRGVD